MPTTKEIKQELRHCYCDFISNVTDQHDQKLLNGIFVDWHMATKASERLEGYTPHMIVENAVNSMNKERKEKDGEAAYHTMILPGLNDLDVELQLDKLPKDLRQDWTNRKLTQHLKKHVQEIKSTIGEEPEQEESKACEDDTGDDEPTLLLCNAANLVFMDKNTMMVNPNIPTPDWFRCANYRLVDTRQNFRVLPLLRQASKIDTVYSAVECTLDEFSKFKEMHAYGVKLQHDEARLWNMTCNYAKELLRANNTRKVREIIMVKHRTLCGVLISGAGVRDMQELTQRLNIKLV